MHVCTDKQTCSHTWTLKQADRGEMKNIWARFFKFVLYQQRTQRMLTSHRKRTLTVWSTFCRVLAAYHLPPLPQPLPLPTACCPFLRIHWGTPPLLHPTVCILAQSFIPHGAPCNWLCPACIACAHLLPTHRWRSYKFQNCNHRWGGFINGECFYFFCMKTCDIRKNYLRWQSKYIRDISWKSKCDNAEIW